ncbi:MAG TPA: TlpA disulfide reductase family protein [Candidatus Acidoferrales bacterium]|nr:TlpA disulfide reductase family protein [Candidatus Acidoferrales bacterium]
MKKSFIAILVLAGIAGFVGLLIGMARARHVAASTPSAVHDATGVSYKQSQDDPPNANTDNVILFASNPMKAPPFLVNDLSGKVISTPQLRGKVVIVNFWATWCPPCRAEIPQLTALASRYKDRLEIIGVAMDDDTSPAEVRAFAAKVGINYPIVMGSQTIAAEYGGVPALPTSFIVDTNGRVVQKHVGLNPPGLFDTEVRALLGLPINAKVATFKDTGQIFLKNAALATELPGVDLKGLTPAQRAAVLKRLNSETCTCGCGLTLAECRINDTSCPISAKLATEVVQEVKSGPPHALHPASAAN